jgi:signal transduction histidine kinase
VAKSDEVSIDESSAAFDARSDRAIIRVEIIETVQFDAREMRALQTLGLLTRGALHEISNPLVGLVGSAELALGETEPGTKLHERVALTHRTGTEIAEIVRALQSFVRSQSHPPERLSLGRAATDAVALVTRVLPTHDVTLAASGDATVLASPGDVACALVDLLVEAIEESGGSVELTVRTDGGEAIVTATGGGELRLPATEPAP